MMRRILFGMALLATPVLAQTLPPTAGPAANGSPAWSYKPSFPDPTGHTLVAADGTVTVVNTDGTPRAAAPVTPPAAGAAPGRGAGRGGRGGGVPSPIRATDDTPGCQRS